MAKTTKRPTPKTTPARLSRLEHRVTVLTVRVEALSRRVAAGAEGVNGITGTEPPPASPLGGV